MADEASKLRAALMQREEALAKLTAEKTAMLKDIERFKENNRRGDMELRKAICELCARARHCCVRCASAQR